MWPKWAWVRPHALRVEAVPLCAVRPSHAARAAFHFQPKTSCSVAGVDATLIRVRGQGLLLKRPKTKAGIRVLQVALWLVTILRERRSRDPESEGAVFPDSIGEHRDPGEDVPS